MILLKKMGFKKEVVKDIFGKADFTQYEKETIDGMIVRIIDWYRGNPRFILQLVKDDKVIETKKLDRWDLVIDIINKLEE